MIAIQKISSKQTHQIRLEILRNGVHLPVQFSGDNDQETFHLGVFEQHELRGIASFMKTSNGLFDKEQYQLRGMATVAEVRGKGYGRLMLLRAFELLRERQVHVLWCNARVNALGFYVKLGFSQKGEKFEIKEIGEHYTLCKEIR
tara:strand:- start:126 stop:560 length:435 start_codon:yes stop_codon:yes gene_type:complete